MLMLWLVLMGTLELADLHTHTDEWGERGSLFISGCGVKVPFSGKKKWWIMTLLCRKQPSLGLSQLGISEDD